MSGLRRTVYGLMLLFGVGSWLAINGIYAELPFMAHRLPEGYSIAATLGIAIQVGNVGPLCYTFLRRKYGEAAQGPAIHFIFLIGILCAILLAFLWSVTVPVGGGQRASVPLIALTCGLALLDATSSVVFWPFAARFPSIYVTALATGEALSSTLPGVLSWIQAAGDGGVCAQSGAPLFSVSAYFGILAAVALFSLAAYRRLAAAQLSNPNSGRTINSIQEEEEVPKEYQRVADEGGVTMVMPAAAAAAAPADEHKHRKLSDDLRGRGSTLEITSTFGDESISIFETSAPRISWIIYVAIAIQGTLQNGLLPSVLPLASNVFTRCTYGAANSTSLTLAPFFALLAAARPVESERTVFALTVVSLICVVYIIAIAALDDKAPMAGGAPGGYLHGTLMVALSCLLAYSKSAAFWLVSEGLETYHDMPNSPASVPYEVDLSLEPDALEKETDAYEDMLLRDGDRRLRKAGIYLQCGSFVGALGIFLAIRYTNWFPS